MSIAQLTEDGVEILKTREASPTNFLMKVESFSLLGENKIHKYESGEFTAGGHKWRLILYSNDDKTGTVRNYISVNLAISNPTVQPANWEITAVFSIFLFNHISGNYHYSSGRTGRFQAMKSEWSISKFISKTILMDPSNGFLIDNNCVFGAEVFMVEKLAISECLSVKKVTNPYKREWKIPNFSKLGDIWNSEQFEVEGLKWKVDLYPKGQDLEKGRNLAIYIRFLGSERVKAEFSICVKNQNNQKPVDHKMTTNIWFSSTHILSWGWKKFMELSTLEDPKRGYIMNDSCLLEIELSVQAVV